MPPAFPFRHFRSWPLVSWVANLLIGLAAIGGCLVSLYLFFGLMYLSLKGLFAIWKPPMELWSMILALLSVPCFLIIYFAYYFARYRLVASKEVVPSGVSVQGVLQAYSIIFFLAGFGSFFGDASELRHQVLPFVICLQASVISLFGMLHARERSQEKIAEAKVAESQAIMAARFLERPKNSGWFSDTENSIKYGYLECGAIHEGVFTGNLDEMFSAATSTLKAVKNEKGWYFFDTFLNIGFAGLTLSELLEAGAAIRGRANCWYPVWALRNIPEIFGKPLLELELFRIEQECSDALPESDLKVEHVSDDTFRIFDDENTISAPVGRIWAALRTFPNDLGPCEDDDWSDVWSVLEAAELGYGYFEVYVYEQCVDKLWAADWDEAMKKVKESYSNIDLSNLMQDEQGRPIETIVILKSGPETREFYIGSGG